MVTLQDVVSRAREDLERAGISSSTAALDAELLARHVLGWDRAAWLTRRTEHADHGFSAAYATLIDRRTNREPVAYIRGIQEFWGREFLVTTSVLIPRPETELIIEVAHAFLIEQPAATVVDLGTGSGCIAVTLALEHPAARIYATDVSNDALVVARENARRLGATVQFTHGAYLADTPSPVDLIVTNPPYVAASGARALAPEVKDFEPATALFGGDDGWREVQAILPRSRGALRRGGHLIMEIGDAQGERVADEVGKVAELNLEDIRSDLQGIPRVVIVRRV